MSNNGFPPGWPYPPGPGYPAIVPQGQLHGNPQGVPREYPPIDGDLYELMDPADAHDFGVMPHYGPPMVPYVIDPGHRDDLGGRQVNRPTAQGPHGAAAQNGDVQSSLSTSRIIIAGIEETYITIRLGKIGSRAQMFASRVQAGTEPAFPNQNGDTENPLAQVPVFSGTTPIGGVLCIAKQVFGADGYGDTVVYDLPAGEVVRQCIACGSSRVEAFLIPRYYTPTGAGTAADPRRYTIGPGGDPLTTLRWNNPKITDLIAVFPTVSRAGVSVGGFVADGSQSVDLVGRATRRFNGTVPVTVADAKSARATVVPVAYRASHVTLTGGFENLGNGTVDPIEMNFVVNGVTIGPFPQNPAEPVPIPSGTSEIRISNAAVVINTGDIAFEVIYYLSF